MSAASMTDTTSATRCLWLVVALCPAIDVSDFTISAIGLGVAALLASIAATIAASIFKSQPQDLRWVLCMLMLAGVVSGLGLLMNAWLHELYGALGIFLPLLIVNPGIQWRAEQLAGDQPSTSTTAGLRLGVTIVIVLVVLGIARELVGRGSVLHDAGALGAWAQAANWQLFRADMGFLLAMLPPGAFIAFGLLLALRNWIVQQRHEQAQDR